MEKWDFDPEELLEKLEPLQAVDLDVDIPMPEIDFSKYVDDLSSVSPEEIMELVWKMAEKLESPDAPRQA